MSRLRRGGLSLALGLSLAAVSHAAEPFPRWDTIIPGGGSARFTILSEFGDAAVVDQETGLVWERSPDPVQRTWPQALLQCLNRTTGNRKGWRLPTVEELASLVDPSQSLPALPAGHPFTNVDETEYVSATTSSTNLAVARAVAIGSAGQVLNAPKAALRPVWCVRGGQGVNPE